MLRTWDLDIQIRRDASTPIHIQIVLAIVDAIRRGRLALKTPMPGSRELAERLHVSRKTVVQAYDELVAQGWLETQQKRGTFVAADLPSLEAELGTEGLVGRTLGHAQTVGFRLYGEPLPMNFITDPGTVDFSDGLPDTRLIPYDVLSRAFRHALITTARTKQLGYGDPRGSLVLRHALADMLNMERGLNTNPEGLCLTRGSQMGIYLAARVLVRPGDNVAFEELSYTPAREAFRACGANIVSVAQDEYGLVPNSLEQLCRKQRIQAVYMTPHHQFPTTVMLPPERRLRILLLAEQFGFAVVEDDYDHEFHFERRPMLPMASIDRWGKVIYIGSLSKVLAPGLRIGYLAASPEVVNRCAAEVMLIDRQGGSVTELAIAELMESGELQRHIRRTLRIYKEKRDLAAEMIRAELADWVNFETPEGGLAFWLRLAAGIDPETLAREALIERVRILPSTHFSMGNTALSGIRLGFADLDESALRTGLRRLQTAFIRISQRSSGLLDV